MGEQSLAAIATETVLGEKLLEITPAGGGSATTIPLGRTTTPYTLSTALQDLGENTAALDKPKIRAGPSVLTDTWPMPHRSGAVRSTVWPACRAP